MLRLISVNTLEEDIHDKAISKLELVIPPPAASPTPGIPPHPQHTPRGEMAPLRTGGPGGRLHVRAGLPPPPRPSLRPHPTPSRPGRPGFA